MTKAKQACIRKPTVEDAQGIKRLVDDASTTGALLPRSLMEIYEHLRDFTVYADEDGVGGCCALHIDTADLAEIRSLVVSERLRGRDIGERLLLACLDEARALSISKAYALTRIPEFFERRHFVRIEKSELPHKVFKDCVRCTMFPGCDEIAVIRDLRETPDRDAAGEE